MPSKKIKNYHKCPTCKKLIYIQSCTVDEDGRHHSFNDKPSIISKNGSKWWHQHGELHRDNDEPAQITKKSKTWFKWGQMHRVGKPAYIEYEKDKKTIKTCNWYWENQQAIKFHAHKNNIEERWENGQRVISYKLNQKMITLVIIQEFQYEKEKAFLCLLNGSAKVYCAVGHWKSQI